MRPRTLLYATLLLCTACSSPTPATPPPATAAGGATIQLPPLATPSTAPQQPTQPAPSLATPVLAQSPTPPPVAATSALYRVAFVEKDDVLNVRSGPGVGNAIVGTLPPGTTDIQVTGPSQQVDQALWVPIKQADLTGWVSRSYLTEQVDPQTFCQSADAQALVERLRAAIRTRDGQALATLIHPQRGLLLRHSWSNPEVHLSAQEAAAFFTDPTARDWGHADGSGLPIRGPANLIILPMLDKDLGPQTACNQVIGGATTGLLILPPGYEALNHISIVRPAPADNTMDWGSWVAGVEYWEGRPYLSFLIHYAWEI